jgi:hypothetical protein
VKISNKKFSFFSSLNQYFPHIPYVSSKNIHDFFGPGLMRDVYLDFRLPFPAKIAAGMLTLGKWWPFKTLPPHGLPLTLITQTSTFPGSNRIVSSQNQILDSCFTNGNIQKLILGQ